MKQTGATKRDVTTVDRIVRTTEKRIRAGGFASVTMRRIADELGMTATALYHHFEDKDALLDRVSEQIYDSIPMPERTLHWTERLRQLILAQQQAHLRYPGLTRFLLVHRTHSQAAFRWIESILQVLLEGGLSEKQALSALNQLTYLVNPLTFLDEPIRRPMRTFTGSVARRLVLKRRARYPYLASLVDRMPTQLYEEGFAAALDGLIANLHDQFGGRGAPSEDRPPPSPRTVTRAPRRRQTDRKTDRS